MNEEHIKEPVILDFSGDVIEALNKLESILYTSGWNKYLVIDPDTPSESKLLFSLLRNGAIAVGEVYYTFANDFTEELKSKAYDYFRRLRKRDMDNIYLNAVNYFSRHEPDIEKTEDGALFYPEIDAYVRCGNLSPKKMFELMQKNDCERVIIFGNSLLYDKEQPWELFHSFEMHAPKEYIMEQLAKMREEQIRLFTAAYEASGAKEIFNKIIPCIYYEEP